MAFQDLRDQQATERVQKHPDLYRKTRHLQEEMAKVGIAWHNPFSNECTPDFCCCEGDGNYTTYFPSYERALKDKDTENT